MLPSYEEVSKNISALQAWERLRHHRNRTILRRSWHVVIGLAIATIGLGMIWYSFGESSAVGSETTEELEGPIYLFLFGLLVLICSPLYIRQAFRKAHKKYSRFYKELIMPPMVANMVGKSNYPPELRDSRFDCRFEADGFISKNQLLEIPIFKSLSKANLYEGEDYFQGTLGVTDFQLCEIRAQKEERDTESGSKVRSTLFEGLVLVADFHKSFEGTTVIVSRKGKISHYLHHVGDLMKTISHNFDKQFRVWTTDETTASYLLPVDMLERLVQLHTHFSKNSMSICLHEGKLTIAIHCIDYFEAKGIKKLENDGILHTYNEIRSILGIVDLLNLNTRIWNKETKPAQLQS
ncbi:DUF3137 domain-containing protein [Paenibacillus gorillae]|uniref:DUF3137 domain-containing protein n=1 Tax=Paenibacillus gorillae TaxID=1243662 RepID=UPI0004AC6314|nr:DUF3137 domain-containing protein [Paenibacillus gorillae]